MLTLSWKVTGFPMSIHNDSNKPKCLVCFTTWQVIKATNKAALWMSSAEGGKIWTFNIHQPAVSKQCFIHQFWWVYLWRSIYILVICNIISLFKYLMQAEMDLHDILQMWATQCIWDDFWMQNYNFDKSKISFRDIQKHFAFANCLGAKWTSLLWGSSA